MATIRFLILLLIATAAHGEQWLGNFSEDGVAGWKLKHFEGETLYRLIEERDSTVLKATTQGGATAYFREQKLDISKTPYLEWSWRTESAYPHANPYEKTGDDYVARVYVVVRLGYFFWQTRAINYVWGNENASKPWWFSPYTDKAAMVVLQKSPSQDWQSERVNTVKDFKRIFGLDISEVDGVAVMTDGDDGGRSATSYYKDIRFTR